MRNKRVLLTGSNGFLGQKLTEHLVRSTSCTLLCTSSSENRIFIQGGYQFEQIDFIDLPTLSLLIKKFSPTHIIHTAAISNVERCERFPDLCRKVNVNATTLLADYCSAHQVHLTFVSTDFIFDGNNGPYKEEDPAAPVNVYGHSKWEAERTIRRSGCKHAILRTILAYGVHGDTQRQNIVTWVREKLEKGESINVVEDQWRMPTWIDDLAEACMEASEREIDGTFHVSGPEMMTVLEMAEKIADFWSLDKTLIRPIKASEIGHDKNRPQRTGFVLDKAKMALDYHPTSFGEALIEIDRQYEEYRK